MTSLARPVAVLAVIALTLTGCGGGEGDGDGGAGSDKKPSSSADGVEPADGETLKTKDFSYVVPKGWTENNKAVPNAESVAADTEDKDGFSDNVNVIRLDPAPVEDLDELEDAAVQELKSSSAANVKLLERQAVDGSQGVHLSSGFSVNDKKYLIEQFNIPHEGVAYVVTFSFSPDVPAAEQRKLSQSVLATWKWAS